MGFLTFFPFIAKRGSIKSFTERFVSRRIDSFNKKNPAYLIRRDEMQAVVDAVASFERNLKGGTAQARAQKSKLEARLTEEFATNVRTRKLGHPDTITTEQTRKGRAKARMFLNHLFSEA